MARTQFSRLSKGRCNILNAPKVEHMMTGVSMARQFRNGDILLTYEDGTNEVRSAAADLTDEHAFPEGLFSIVSYVQAGRADGSSETITIEVSHERYA